MEIKITENNKKFWRVYLGCSLTHAPDEFIKAINDLKIELRKNYEVLDFLGLSIGTEREVFTHDTKMVKECDLLLAECSYPTTGLGIEMGIALSLNKPILAIAKQDAKIGRLILGIDHPLFTFARYQDMKEVLELVHKKLSYINKFESNV